MKKVLAICLAMVMVVGMSLTAFAAPGAFVSSPSGNPAPVLVEATCESEDCEASLTVTSYYDRGTLSDEARSQMEQAYSDIVSASDLTSLNKGLADLATEKNIPSSNLAVSDLFDISYENCDNHDGHGNFDIVLKAETLKNFVGLMHLVNGEWQLVEDARVYTVDGVWHLAFSTKDFTPFAIVVETDGTASADSADGTIVGGSNSIQTGDTVKIALLAIFMVASALALVVVLKKSRKQND